MKLEKVNDHQIRCTLTKADLADRHMKLSELAYGTDKAKSLFRDMLQQASFEFGFDAEDIPLMIEAIPLSGDCIVLIITKVEDPEELDTRFSKFAPSVEEGSEIAEQDSQTAVSAEDVLDLFKKIKAGLAETAEKISSAKSAEKIAEDDTKVSVVGELVRLYEFESMDQIIRFAHVLKDYYHGNNSVYRCEDPRGYYLLIDKGDHTPEEYNKVCNIAAEYGKALRYSKGICAFLSEHGKVILEDTALQQLTEIG